MKVRTTWPATRLPYPGAVKHLLASLHAVVLVLPQSSRAGAGADPNILIYRFTYFIPLRAAGKQYPIPFSQKNNLETWKETKQVNTEISGRIGSIP